MGGHYLHLLREVLQGQPHEQVAVCPMTHWETYPPIILATGDGTHCSYERRHLVTTVQAYRCSQFVFAHSQPVNGQIYPSVADLKEAAALQHLAKGSSLQLLDVVIVSRDGRALSFLHEQIMQDLWGEKALALVKKGLELAYGQPIGRRVS